MAKAIWHQTILADSDETIVVEGNHYFPADSVRDQFLVPSDHHTWCGWKGQASYFDVVVDGQVNSGAAWHYPEPFPGASQVKDRVAFWRGVKVIE